MFMKILVKIKKCLILVIIQVSQNIQTSHTNYDDLNKLVVAKMQDETDGLAIKEFVELKPKMIPFW